MYMCMWVDVGCKSQRCVAGCPLPRCGISYLLCSFHLIIQQKTEETYFIIIIFLNIIILLFRELFIILFKCK